MVVMKTVGKSTMSAKPTQKDVKTSAASRPRRSETTRVETKTLVAKDTKRRSGIPLRTMWVRRRAYDQVNTVLQRHSKGNHTESFGLATANSCTRDFQSARFCGETIESMKP